MTKKIVFGAALALLVVSFVATDASAFCNPPKFVSSYNSVTGAFTYWVTTDTAQAGPLSMKATVGAVEVGKGCQFIYFGTTPGQVGLSGDFGACGFVDWPGTTTPQPCPNGPLTIIGHDGGDTFGATVPDLSASQALNFDFSTVGGSPNGGTVNGVHTPRPRVTSSSRSGTGVVLALTLDTVAGAGIDATTLATITGYNVLSASSTGDPGRLASSYAPVAPIAISASAPSGVAATAGGTVDCSVIAKDQWIVTQIVTTAGPLPGVSDATRIRCNAAIANPSYKMVKKPVVTSTDK